MKSFPKISIAIALINCVMLSAGAVTLTINVVGNGTTNPSPGSHSYGWATNVTVTATADTGWSFDHWEGDLSGSDNPESIRLWSSKTVTAVFVQDTTFTLTTAVQGSGTVDPAGVNTYDGNDEVTVTATPSIGWVFDHWEGDLTGAVNPDTVTMTGNAAVTAVFVESTEAVFNTYFGYLHSHSELSDGDGTAMEAYTYARDVGELDFFALTDHGEDLAIWPWENKYEELKAAAEATNDPGSYVTLYGFEWSNPVLGHISILNTSDYTNCVDEPGLGDIFNWIGDRPEAFARFNHPGRYDDVGTEFLHLELDEPVVSQMVGIEFFNKGDGFDRYYYSGSWTSSYSYADEGNLNGWYLGALGGQDTHGADWGTKNQFRTAVLAPALTRWAIIDAYRNRRFYVTEDKDLHLDFRCNDYPMGSQLIGGTRDFEVSAFDAGGDQFQEVRLYRNGLLLQITTVSGNSVTATFSDTVVSGTDYYYVIVTQTDDNDSNGRNDEAISSPIWITND